MSGEGHPVFSAGGPGNTKAGRVVYASHCDIHDVNYGRELVPSTPAHESYLLGNCPRCEEDVRIRLAWKQEVLRIASEVKAETDQFCASEEGRQERLIEMKEELKNEDRAKRAEEFFKREDEHFALQDADYLAYVDSQDKGRIDAENIEKRRIAFFEQQQGLKAQADAELQKKLDEDRERKAKEALASWVTFG